MWGKIANFFTGGGMKSIENIATEWIETDKEKAEAKTIMIKALDPNGMMRRELSTSVRRLYTIYIITMLLMLVAESFGWGPMNGDQLAVSVATEKITKLFVPITTMFSVIIGASFGVNYANIRKDK